MSSRLGQIRGIVPEHTKTWEDRVFLSFDLDWCTDEVLEYTIDLVEKAGAPATWMVTHDTPLLERLYANDRFEVGIHPNFEPLLNGNLTKGSSAEEVVGQLLSFIPEAKTVRSHSMAQSNHLLNMLEAAGLERELNQFIPAHVKGALSPWRHWNGLIRIPCFWEDDIHILYDYGDTIDPFLVKPGLRVFNFHPIHVYLNTEQLSRYDQVKAKSQDAAFLRAHENKDPTGTRRWLEQLLSLA